jgi:hypothetical protein
MSVSGQQRESDGDSAIPHEGHIVPAPGRTRLFLRMGFVCGMLCGVPWVFSRRLISLSRLLTFPSLVGFIVFLTQYAKNARER